MEQYIYKNQQKLKYGITTGTCGAAAARAAAQHLFLGIKEDCVLVHTPKGAVVEVPVTLVSEGDGFCEYMVIKDSGDDPDVTNGAEIHVCVEYGTGKQLPEDLSAFHSDVYPTLYLRGGKGVGRVTKQGLEQQVGQAAINTVPRAMMFQAVGEVLELTEKAVSTVWITISVPEGETLARRTFNPRLGIEGGISILGTTGILEPMSERAIIDTIEVEIRQLAQQGKRQLLVTPGNYGQAYAEKYLHMDLEQSVKCSNYIGEAIDLAISYGMESFLLVGNVGKLVKLAAGIMNTHSRIADGRREIFATHTVLCGGTVEMVRTIMNCINTEEMLSYLQQWQLKNRVMDSICGRIGESMQQRIGGRMNYRVVLFSEKYGYLGETEG